MRSQISYSIPTASYETSSFAVYLSIAAGTFLKSVRESGFPYCPMAGILAISKNNRKVA